MKTDHMIRSQISRSQTIINNWCKLTRVGLLIRKFTFVKDTKLFFNVDRSNIHLEYTNGAC